MEPTASSLASALSFAGFLSDKPSGVPSEAEAVKAQCSVEVYSEKEILVKVPQGTKSSWLAKGAINIDVYRGEKALKTKLSSIDEGLLIEIGKDEAFGVLNISVVTSRKPRINETIRDRLRQGDHVRALEAGMQLLHGIAHRVASTAGEAAHLVEDNCLPAAADSLERLRGDAQAVLKGVARAG